MSIADDRGIVSLPRTDPAPLLLAPPIIGVEYTEDATTAYGTLSVVYPIILGWPVDEDVTGSFRTDLLGQFTTQRRPGSPSVTATRFSPSRSGSWRIRAGQTSTVVPVLTYRAITGQSGWLEAVTTALIGAIASFAFAFAAATALLSSAATTGGALAVSAGIHTGGTVTVTTAVGTMNIVGLSAGAITSITTSLNLAGLAIAGGISAAVAGLGARVSVIATGNDIGISGATKGQFLQSFNITSLTATGQVSNIRGPATKSTLTQRTVID